MDKIKMEHVKVFAKKAGKVAGWISLALVSQILNKDYTPVKYSDAISAIINSSMWSEDKKKAMDVLIRNGDPELYKSVISVINDYSMYSSDKVEVIRALCEKGES